MLLAVQLYDSFKQRFMLILPCQMMVTVRAMSPRVVLRKIMENCTPETRLDYVITLTNSMYMFQIPRSISTVEDSSDDLEELYLNPS